MTLNAKQVSNSTRLSTAPAAAESIYALRRASLAWLAFGVCRLRLLSWRQSCYHQHDCASGVFNRRGCQAVTCLLEYEEPSTKKAVWLLVARMT